jgi:hypothetical protein
MKRWLSASWAMAAIVAICGPAARAELPPSAYPDPRGASEIVDIEVLSARETIRLFASNFQVRRYNAVVTAKVREVHRTTINLKPGATITLRYETRSLNPGVCGPGSMPVPARGTVCRVHLMPLNGWSGGYEPYGAPYSAFAAVGDSNSRK